MVVKDLRNSFNPVPKHQDKKLQAEKILEVKKQTRKTKTKKKKQTKNKTVDFCIMPKNNSYSTVRTKKYCERHEVYFSGAYRDKSIEDGLIVFLTRKDHRGTNGVHGKNGDKLNRKLKRIGQKAWMDYYKKTKEEFIERYGKSNL